MIVGVDEVGRGCWAGPLVAGAVALVTPISGLDDSKVLSKNQREKLADIIRFEAAAYSLGWVTSKEIDELGLSGAIRLAMQRAVDLLKIGFDELIVDGNINYFPDEPRARAIIKADALVPAVSAASIIAKVARDAWMTDVAAKKFPHYCFEKHVGYGTLLHRETLLTHGICNLHRRSFKPIRNLWDRT
ncbi:MAG TPA: ribonuclease HII, partial [Candidatus Saccharimonadales bacterium]|nr:ribonuclease HII [Candidatus Saccharimonadales bacterium]